MKVEIEIHGLKPYLAHLKDVEQKLPREVRKVNNEAARIVVVDARPHIPRVSGTAARTVKAQSTQRQARVVGGGNQAPYYGWLDFGGWGGTNKANYRTIYQEGRYIYASFHRHESEFVIVMRNGLVQLAQSSGLEVEVT